VEVALTLGPDLARPLRPVWSAIEDHAEELDRLCQQQAGLRFAVTTETGPPALTVEMKLAGSDQALRVLLNDEGIRYYWIRGSDLIEIDPKEPRIDRGVYLILAELAGESSAASG
jgi:hypothetical protein